MDPTGRFGDRADDYVKYRPTYPAAVVDAILEGTGDPRRLVAADVGAGTGISARLLADQGVRVVAMEPNEGMRKAAATHPLVEWRDGTAERTGLADGAVGLVLCAQAFHWFRADEAVAEFARVLRPRGRLALVWNERDEGDALTAAYSCAIRKASEGHPAEVRAPDVSAVARSGLFGAVRRLEFANSQGLDRAGLIGRALSASYVPKSGERREEMVRELEGVFERFARGGAVALRYRVSVYLAERS